MNDVHRADYWYRSPAPCAQGPFEIRIPARGDSWGEKLTLQVYSPRKVAFRVDFRTSDQERFFSSFIGEESRMENKECLVSETMEKNRNQAATAGEPEKTGQPADSPPSGTPPAAGNEVPPPPVELIRTNPESTAFQSRPAARMPGADASLAPGEQWVYTLSLFDAQRRAIDGPVPFPKGTQFVIRIWSVLPNDLRDVRFLLEHRQYKPEPSEKKYVAKLRKEQRERERAALKRQREAERRRQKQIEQEQRRQKAQAEAARSGKPVKTAKPAKPPKPKKVSYMGCVTGRYKGGRVQICRKFTDYAEYSRCIADPRDIPCWHVPRKGRWHYSIAEAPRPQAADDRPKPRPADSPPPAPRAEEIPPQPSQNAVWVPGYWKWNGFSWVWLYGFWRVPQSDLEAEKTVVAPAEPPPPKVETREPQPLPEAVWSAGYWHWDGNAWIWVSGRWVIAPQREQIWVAPSWRRTPRGLLFVPGHWRRR